MRRRIGSFVSLTKKRRANKTWVSAILLYNGFTACLLDYDRMEITELRIQKMDNTCVNCYTEATKKLFSQ